MNVELLQDSIVANDTAEAPATQEPITICELSAEDMDMIGGGAFIYQF
jgi:hypothetical protein